MVFGRLRAGNRMSKLHHNATDLKTHVFPCVFVKVMVVDDSTLTSATSGIPTLTEAVMPCDKLASPEKRGHVVSVYVKYKREKNRTDWLR